MSWQGWVRVIARNFDRLVVGCAIGHERLYDRASDFVTYSIPGRRDCWRLVDPHPAEVALVEEKLSRHGGTRLRPLSYIHPSKQIFVKLGDASRVAPERRYDVLVHARGRVGKRAHHSWDPTGASAVVRGLEGLRVGCIGTEAFAVEGADDLRGLPLSILCDIMAAARLVISPVSGPSVLAGLCGTAFLCWTDGGHRSVVRERDDFRMRGSWNPLNTRCTVLVQRDWRPDPRMLLHEAAGLLK